MSARLTELVLDFYPGRGSELLLAVMFAHEADEDGTCIAPGIARAARWTRLSERMVKRLIVRMTRERGWLQLVKTEARSRPREYRIHPDWIRSPRSSAWRNPTRATRAAHALETTAMEHAPQ